MPDAAPLVLLCSPDLMFAVRVESAATMLGYRLRTAASPAEVTAELAAERPAAAVIDLAAAGAELATTVAALRSAKPAPFVLGFFPHVQRELGAAGQEAGCALVVPRSRFMAELPALLRQAVESPPAAVAPRARQE